MKMKKLTEIIPFFLMIMCACYSERSANIKKLLHEHTAPQ